ncbi:hypothetical protein AAMO2058_000149000 [Amorphochlora amoebiformis]
MVFAAEATEATPLSGLQEDLASDVDVAEEIRTELAHAKREAKFLRVLCAMSIAFGIFTATALVIFTNDIEDGRLHRGGSPKGVEGEDALRHHSGDTKASIFNELSKQEIALVAKYFTEQTNSSACWSPQPVDYLIGPSAVELLSIPKKEALAYIDSTGEYGPKPPRYARVTLLRRKEGDIIEYKVGPIITGKYGRKSRIARNATIEPLIAAGAIPASKRPPDFSEDYRDLVASVITPIRNYFVQAFGPILIYEPTWEAKNGLLGWFARADITSTKEKRVGRIQFLWFHPDLDKLPKSWMHPVPFGFRVDFTRPDPQTWKPFDFLFCNQGPFHNMSGLQYALKTGQIKMCKLNFSENSSSDWDIPNPKHPHEKGPVTRQSYNPRYKIKNGNVEWMGWKFQVTNRPSKGPALYDVRIHGQRILYELSLQDAYAAYGGSYMEQFYYPDASFSLSQITSGNLLKGIDCPHGAHMIKSSKWMGTMMDKGRLKSVKDFKFIRDPLKPINYYPVCIFEEDRQTSLFRHTNTATGKVSAGRMTNLVVRAIGTVGNYDYITSFKFHLDGTIEVTSEYAGYCETRWINKDINPWEEPFGTTTHEGLSLPVHSHLVNVKADFDILGTRNSYVKTSVEIEDTPKETIISKQEKRLFSKSAPKTKVMKNTLVAFEGSGVSTAVVNVSKPTVWRIVNTEAIPAAGKGVSTEPRGYAIVPLKTNIQVLPNDHPFTIAASYTKYNLAVTKRKETEDRVSSVYDIYGPSNPVTSLDRFLEDEEKIIQEDLVAWITVGKEHITRTEDLPLVSNFGSGFMLQPWNYFDKNAAMLNRIET